MSQKNKSASHQLEPSAQLEQRMTQLEELVTHQAVLIEEMSQQLHDDYVERQKLERRVAVLLERLKQIEVETTGAPDAEKPPHY